eukprot:scaffold83460_cov66-Cyclotella_meneghiniana.AAC.9
MMLYCAILNYKRLCESEGNTLPEEPVVRTISLLDVLGGVLDRVFLSWCFIGMLKMYDKRWDRQDT